MSKRLPLFPLGSVLYPGLLLPLHIFEERYRQLVRDLRAGPEPGQFGVIAIRRGRETGADGVLELHEIGCTASVRRITERDDGRFDLLTVGSRRFRLKDVDRSRPYLQGEVELLREEAGDDALARTAVPAVQRAFRDYRQALARQGTTQLRDPDLPDGPVLLSYLVAAAMIIDLPAKQSLLAQPDAASRLAAERVLLSRELSMLRSLASAPATDLPHSDYNPN